MKPVYFLLILLLLVACSSAPSEGSIQTAIAQTQAAKKPVEKSDIIPLLYQSGDIDGIVIGDLSTSVKDFYQDIPPYAKIELKQDLTYSGVLVGWVTFISYSGEEDTTNAYNFTSSKWMGVDATSSPTVGEQSSISSFDYSEIINGVKGLDLLFMRCNSMAHIHLIGITDKEVMVNFAEQLDSRITKVLCR